MKGKTMNKEIKKKWVEALRSGKYKQGKGRLREGDAFCCLGVLCDIVSPKEWTEYGQSGRCFHGIKLGCLSETVTEATGITPHGRLAVPVTYKGRKCLYLDKLNDEGATFEEIADVIEEQF